MDVLLLALLRRFSFLLSLGALFLLSCVPPEEKKACTEDRQCAKGEICLQTVCLAGCRQHSDCTAGQFCRDLQCTAQLCKPGENRECYDGEPSLAGKGVCKKGAQWCDTVGRAWSACIGQRLVQDEICDSQDNDCDGQTDEGLQCDCKAGVWRSCYTGPVGTQGTGLCNLGVQYCEDNLRWGACHDQGLPRREVCDQLDNDCNGAIDDGIDCTCEPGATRECYSGPEGSEGKGVCKKGEQTCQTNRLWGACKGQILPRPEEIAGDGDPDALCNSKDENCDGSVDNRSGKPEVPHQRSCYEGLASSLRKGDCKEGLQTCKGGAWSPCEGQITPQVEACNGKDDDCNGLIDDAIPPRSCLSPTNTGCQTTPSGALRCLGLCGPGQETCVVASATSVPNPATKPPPKTQHIGSNPPWPRLLSKPTAT